MANKLCGWCRGDFAVCEHGVQYRLKQRIDTLQADNERLRRVVEDALLVLDPAEETTWAKSARAALAPMDRGRAPEKGED